METLTQEEKAKGRCKNRSRKAKGRDRRQWGDGEGRKKHQHCADVDQTPQCDESLAVIDGINQFGSKLLLVGFGAPRQEAWLHAHRDQIDAQAVLTCGACMEYVAGEVSTPPRWMGQVGLEWSFRLFENPRRFAFRYLVEPILLAFMLARNWVGERLGKKAER